MIKKYIKIFGILTFFILGIIFSAKNIYACTHNFTDVNQLYAECGANAVDCNAQGQCIYPQGTNCQPGYHQNDQGVCVQNTGNSSDSFNVVAQTGQNIKCNCGTKTYGACGDYYGLTNIKYRGPCALSLTGPHTCNAKVGVQLFQYQSCDNTTPSPTITGGVTPTGDPTPTNNPLCVCNALDSCSNQCTFNKLSGITTYNNPIKCKAMPNTRYPTPPVQANKNDWCRRPNRVQGDADGNDKVTIIDYFYLVAGQFGGKIPARINVDFNGDGAVNGEDRAVIIKGLSQ